MHGLVELADAGKSRRKGDSGKREICLVDKQAGCLCSPAAGQGKWANTHLCHKLAMQMPYTHSQAVCQSSHSLCIDNAIGDEPQCAGNQVGPHIPVWRTGACFWMAAAAGSKPGGLCRGGTGIETHMMSVGCWCRADGSAVDTSRGNCRKEPPIEAGISAANSAIAKIEIVVNECCIHILIIPES